METRPGKFVIEWKKKTKLLRGFGFDAVVGECEA
jgi:hypothetical protein